MQVLFAKQGRMMDASIAHNDCKDCVLLVGLHRPRAEERLADDHSGVVTKTGGLAVLQALS